MSFYLLPFIGFLIGLIVTLIGGGGGIFYVLILTLGYNVDMSTAVSTSLATIIPTTFVASISHHRSGNLRIRKGVYPLLGGIIGAVGGALLTSLFVDSVLRRIFGLFMLVMGSLVYKGVLKQSNPNKLLKGDTTPSAKKKSEVTNKKYLASAGYGLLGGVMAGMLGLSGAPPIVTGLYLLGNSAVEVIGTSVFVVLGISCVGLSTHLALGQVNWYLVEMLAIGTTAGAFIGPNFLKYIDTAKLEKYYSPVFFIMAVGIGLILIF
ncbi:MAG TPA: sulfite exporter TauE/SafE family protein [Bacteroidales bacterium]|nr:sulfite exporter TauE/SafE family protein [Bacteroidales bacterium]